MAYNNLEHQEAIQKLKSLVAEVKVGMLATVHSDYSLMSRPMHTLQVDDEGNLWFFTNEHSEKVEDLSHDNNVYLMYAHPGNHTYAHVKGKGVIVNDRSKIDELWSDIIKAWFPEGKDDPKLCLLKVETEEASYWDDASSKLVVFLRIAKALATGEKHDSEMGHLDLNK